MKIIFYIFVNITSVAIVLSAWFGGHINSWVEILGGVLGWVTVNGLVYLLIPSNKEKGRR